MCDVRCIAIIALTKELQYPLIPAHTPTKTLEHIVSTLHYIVYITVTRVWQHLVNLTKLVFQIQEKIKPTFIFCHVSTSRQSCVTVQLLLHRVRRRLNSLEVFHHSQCNSLAQ